MLILEFPLADFHNASFKAPLPCHELQMTQYHTRELYEYAPNLEHPNSTQDLEPKISTPQMW